MVFHTSNGTEALMARELERSPDRLREPDTLALTVG